MVFTAHFAPACPTFTALSVHTVHPKWFFLLVWLQLANNDRRFRVAESCWDLLRDGERCGGMMVVMGHGGW